MKAASKEKVTNLSIKPSLKRKVGYINEGISITRAKLSEIRISEEKKKEEETRAGPSERCDGEAEVGR